MNPPRRLQLIIAYNGGPFEGWQSQRSGNTVQDLLERALLAICKEKTAVHGAGRTDAGVHAVAQCAHADVRHATLTPERWPAAINAQLPPEIRVMRARWAAPEFHARFQARGKVYVYRLWNHSILPPFELGRAWHQPTPLDLEPMARAAKMLEGTHDFAAFAANRGKPKEVTVRTVHRVRIRRAGVLWTFRFEGNGFLYRMVRLLTGTLVRCGQHRMEPALVAQMLETGRKTSFAAPAEGLYLQRVLY